MIGIGVAAVTGKFAINVSAPFTGVFQFFENDDTGTFTHDKSVAVFIERTGCVLRVVVTRAQGFHSGKARYGTGRNGGLRPACNGGIELTALNHAESVANRVRSGRTGRDDTGTVPLQAEGNGNLTGRHVGNHLGNDEGIDTGRALVEEAFV